jgi:4-hydroxy-tetrahydrodipicolinate reductase
MIPIVLVGAAGRMGRAVEEAARASADVAIRSHVDRAAPVAALAGGANPGGEAGVWSEDASAVVRSGDVVIEFSVPSVCRAVAGLCAERGAALVSGTTGLSPDDEAAVRTAARRTPVVRSANFSLGIAALHRALDAVLEALPAGWDVEIVERHHRHKADSPSGTALALARRALARRGLGEDALVKGRSGRGAGRPGTEIGIHSVRGGSWVGEHAILFAGDGESIELRHVAESRAAFAAGAIAAARWVSGAPPGLYSLDDVLGSR